MAGKRPHALAFSVGLQSHITPLMQLCKVLAASGESIITFVNTESNHSRILEANQKLGITRQSSDFRLVGLPDTLYSDACDRRATVKGLATAFERCMAPQLEQLIKELNETCSPVTCFISDLNVPWAIALAKKLMIPLVAGFWPSLAAGLSVAYHIPYLRSTGELDPNGSGTGKITSLPGLQHLQTTCLPWIMGTDDEDNEYLFQNTKRAMEEAQDLKWILCNTCSEWETKVIEALPKELPIFTVGPLFFSDNLAKEANKLSTAVWSEENECLEWLDTQATSSVLYVSFGSVATLSSLQLHEIALGLEASRQPFLLALRTNLMDGTAPVLPEGFAERTRDRARLVAWAPQSLVLSHRSTGWFLTHSGWNSVAESISMGVPMLALAFLGDLRMIYKYIVEEWGVAMGFAAGEDGWVSRDEVEKVVRCAMCEGEEAVEMRRRVGKLRDAARAAMNIENGGGSSYTHIQAFMQEITKHYNPSTTL